MDILVLTLEAGAYLLIALLLLWLAKSIFLVYEKWIDREDEFSSVLNTAEGIRRSGLFIGSAIALSAPLVNGSHETFMDDILVTMMDAAAIIILMLFTTTLNDKVLIHHLDNGDEAASNNVTVSLIEFGSYLATGLVLFGSFVGSGPWVSSIVFFILTQVLLIIIMRLYEWQVPFDLEKAISENNIAAGTILAGMMISYGVVLSSVVSGNFVSWEADLYAFFLSALIAVSMIAVVFNGLIDKLFLPKLCIHEAIEQNDMASIIVAASLKISLSVIIAQVII